MRPCYSCIFHSRLRPDGRGSFIRDGDKSWYVAEDTEKGEVFINFGPNCTNNFGENEGDDTRTKRLKRTADGATKNKDDETDSLLLTVVTPLRCDKENSVSCRDVIRDIAGSKPHYLGPGDLRSAERIEGVKF